MCYMLVFARKKESRCFIVASFRYVSTIDEYAAMREGEMPPSPYEDAPSHDPAILQA